MKSTVSQLAVPIRHAGMSHLETLPVEIFDKIGDCLAFFDKQALQATSKRCLFLVGSVTYTDGILWGMHAYRSGLRSPSDNDAMTLILDFVTLVSNCLKKDRWIDLSQGQEA